MVLARLKDEIQSFSEQAWRPHLVQTRLVSLSSISVSAHS